ncbi:hypothetical protein PI172_0360 [Prevotella intermedia]|uniref:Uncharacterized protein n=2 Tax=Prevotella intermedia TaxID=28131 RepID=A0A0H5AZ52_PREIN|nr:hypothetical protein [Prevotella intermedia]AFJ09271.1 hypothetical protein PIN17_A0395 [Prevotella intermedia 17]APW33467.1 hypothetical protein BWX40_00555 [Prevotella intermedia]BAR95088.1 hypothetical protein PI172_0360 [Prevotella intermedia]BAU18542.1 hypothetical protein PIOMA14_II_0037 [Prevotella intermedia]
MGLIMDKYNKMNNLMQEYEKLAQTNLNLALRKMIDLYFSQEYDNCFNYDVYDGIELWLQENADKQLISYIKSKYDKDISGYTKLMEVIEAGINR